MLLKPIRPCGEKPRVLKITTMKQPLIGISVDNYKNTASSGKYEVSAAYSRCVAAAGGVPVMLPHEPGLAEQFLMTCSGIVLTGGVDPRTEAFDQPTHPRARPMDPGRQAFELSLLAVSDKHPHKPVLGVCLGMQLMALRAGGRLDQYLPETLANPQLHQHDNRHPVTLQATDSVLVETPLGTQDAVVVSNHQQAVAAGCTTDQGGQGRARTAGTLRIVATAPDGVIEAIDDPARGFYLGVQWHPERGGSGLLNQGLFDRLVEACRCAKPHPSSAPHQSAVMHRRH